MVCRFIAGIAVGLTSSVVPIYQSEIAPKDIRGRIVSLQQFAITLGILLAARHVLLANYNSTVLYSIRVQPYQWNSIISVAVGNTDDPGADPIHWPLLLSQIPEMARYQGKMG